jgi:hypothetical protein
MIDAVDLARLGCGGLFLTGLITGVWKYRAMFASPEATAPVYVDICHRASLMYAFACLVLAEFAGLSAWNATVNLIATATPILFFALAVASYAIHGFLRDTDNQLQRPHRRDDDCAQRRRFPVHPGSVGRRDRRLRGAVCRLSAWPWSQRVTGSERLQRWNP